MFQSSSEFIERGMAVLRQHGVLLEQSFGLRRLVWGRDWPHLQHEDSISAGECASAIDRALSCVL